MLAKTIFFNFSTLTWSTNADINTETLNERKDYERKILKKSRVEATLKVH